MGESKRDLEALSRRYEELGFNLSAEDIGKFVPRIEQIETALDSVRSIDVSGNEGALTFLPRRLSGDRDTRDRDNG